MFDDFNLEGPGAGTQSNPMDVLLKGIFDLLHKKMDKLEFNQVHFFTLFDGKTVKLDGVMKIKPASLAGNLDGPRFEPDPDAWFPGLMAELSLEETQALRDRLDEYLLLARAAEADVTDD